MCLLSDVLQYQHEVYNLDIVSGFQGNLVQDENTKIDVVAFFIKSNVQTVKISELLKKTRVLMEVEGINRKPLHLLASVDRLSRIQKECVQFIFQNYMVKNIESSSVEQI